MTFMQKTYAISTLIVISMIFAGFAGIGNAASLGVSVANPESPGEYDMFFRNMLRGGYAERDITISSSTGTTPLDVFVIVDDAFKGWVTFEPGTNFTMIPGTQFHLKAIVQPPKDMPNGNYAGLVTMRASPSAVNGSSNNRMTIAAAVALKTAVEITGEQVVNWKVNDISVSDTEEGLPLKFSVVIFNSGNVKAMPRIVVDILNQNKTSVLKSESFSDAEVLPSVTSRLNFTVSSDGLAVGQYWADVKIYSGDNLSKESVLTVDVLEKGSLRITGDLVQVWCPTWADVGHVVSVNAIFRNTGELVTSAKFKGEVHLGDVLADVLESDELDVPVGGQMNVTMYYTPRETGRYVIGGYMMYSKKITDVKECILNVRSADGSLLTGAVTGLAGAGFDLATAGGLAAIAIVSIVAFKTKIGRAKSPKKFGKVSR